MAASFILTGRSVKIKIRRFGLKVKKKNEKNWQRSSNKQYWKSLEAEEPDPDKYGFFKRNQMSVYIENDKGVSRDRRSD